MIASLLAVLPLLVPGLTGRNVSLLLFPLAIAVVIGLLFGTLTVVVDDQWLSARFGVGLIRKNVSIGEIRSVAVVRNRWYYGWGIRFIPAGQLYNVSGFSAVDLLLSNGRHVRVGTDEPEALESALRKVVGELAPASAEQQRADANAGRRFVVVMGFGAFIVAALVLGLLYVGMQPPTVNVSPTTFSVRGGGFYGAEIPFRDIAELSLQDTVPRVLRKTNGFNAGNTLRGHFRLEVLGDGQMFINRGISPYVVMRTRDSFVIVNFKDPQRTRDLYAELRRHVGF